LLLHRPQNDCSTLSFNTTLISPFDPLEPQTRAAVGAATATPTDYQPQTICHHRCRSTVLLPLLRQLKTQMPAAAAVPRELPSSVLALLQLKCKPPPVFAAGAAAASAAAAVPLLLSVGG
jgi:hypothetical protein